MSQNSITAIIASTLVRNSSTRIESEATQYLRTPPLDIYKQPDPLKCWKVLETEYPTIAQMARDILAIPATGVGVERLFNVGRDTCHYRRNRLNGDTIQMIMLIKYFERIGISLSEVPPSVIESQPASLSVHEEREHSLSVPIDEEVGDDIGDICEWESEFDDDSVLGEFLDSGMSEGEDDDLPPMPGLGAAIAIDPDLL